MPRRLIALVSVAALALVAAAPADAKKKNPKKKAAPPITISGAVYTFDNQEPIAGATVRVAELPNLLAVSGADGSYTLKVPDGRKFTPYSDAAGHHRIFLQTWISHGEDMRGVNFQMPTEGTFTLLAALLDVPLDANNELVNCGVVSTFVNQAVRDLTFPQFVAFGAHGVAGAVARATPTLPDPVYFNEQVIPDRTRTSSSIDGGVIWPVVPAGLYLMEGFHPTKRFAPFVATCEPGRVVNANPVQGLYELRPGEEIDDNVEATDAVTIPGFDSKKGGIKVRIRAREYVRVTVELFLRKQKKPSVARREKLWSPGNRTYTLPFSRKARLQAHRVVVEIQDAAFNGVGSTLGSSKTVTVKPKGK